MTVTLLTGGTGSFGSTVARSLLIQDRVSELRILSRDEAKQDDLGATPLGELTPRFGGLQAA